MTDTSKKSGYVYILTNPSFREDWIKIGKTSKKVDIRSKELDNTAVPLPFEVYATLKTAEYDNVEKLLHQLLQGSGVRIRNNREFFNVRPEVALDAFYKIAKITKDGEVTIGDQSSYTEPEEPRPSQKLTRKSKVISSHNDLIPVNDTTELKKNAKYTFDGDVFYSMAEFFSQFLRRLLHDNPKLTYAKLKEIFPNSLLTSFLYCGVIAKKSEIESSNHKEECKIKAYHLGNDEYLLHTNSDKVDFYATTQWMRESFKRLLTVIERLGYHVYTK